MRISYIIIWLLFVVYKSAIASNTFSLLPYPNQVTWHDGAFETDVKMLLYCNPIFEGESKKLIHSLKKECNISARFSNQHKANFKIIYQENMPNEGYKLNVNKEGIEIIASTNAGVFYASQTLKQLLIKDGKEVKCPFVEVEDSPAFSWRGFLLDEARNFQGKVEVKKILDEMASLKMNVFHWHLTDDQGWRIEIKKYPLLTEIGARRDSTQLNWYESTLYDGVPVGGYYTQKDILEVVKYAADRHIKVVPEIEFPGHASAAISAYPWLSCDNKQIKVPCNYGVLSTVFNVVNPEVQRFIYDVLDEVMALFPSDIIHIGGDEVKYDEWLASKEVQAFMKDNNIDSGAELQVWFTNKLSNYIASKGKMMMGWNDITGDKLHAFQQCSDVKYELNPQNTIVHFWVGSEELLTKALEKGLKVVNNYSEYTYLNYNYDKIVPGLEYAHTPISLEKAYWFNPIPKAAAQYSSQILGIQCAMWGEWTNTPNIMYRMVYPQIATYAEVGWTQVRNKNFNRFLQSLDLIKDKWKSIGYIQ